MTVETKYKKWIQETLKRIKVENGDLNVYDICQC